MKHLRKIAFALAPTISVITAQAQLVVTPGPARLDVRAEIMPYGDLHDLIWSQDSLDYTETLPFDSDGLQLDVYNCEPNPDGGSGCLVTAGASVLVNDWYLAPGSQMTTLNSSLSVDFNLGAYDEVGLPVPGLEVRAAATGNLEVSIQVTTPALATVVLGGLMDGYVAPGDDATVSATVEENGVSLVSIVVTASVELATRHFWMLPGRTYRIRYDMSVRLVRPFEWQTGAILNGLVGFSLGINPDRCPSDVNSDGSVDGDDVIAFFSAWDQNEPGGDYNQNGSVDGDDVIGFFAAWDSGC